MACKFCFSLVYTKEGREAYYFQSDSDEEYRVQYEILENHDILVNIDWTYPKHVLATAELHTKDFFSRISSEGNIVNGKEAALLLCNKAKASLIIAQYDVICSISITPYVSLCKPTETDCSRYPKLECVVDTLSGLSVDMQELYLSKNLTDGAVSNGKIKLKVHKAILSARSSVFCKKFSTGKKYFKCVTIPLTSDDALKDFINFIYSGVIEFRNIKLTQELYKLAYEYEVEDLFETCSSYLLNVTLDNALDIVCLADECNDKHLKDSAFDFIRDNISAVKDGQTWKLFSENHPNLVTDVLSFVDGAEDSPLEAYTSDL